MSKDTTSFEAINTKQVFPVFNKTGFVSFIERQDEVFSPCDTLRTDTNNIIQVKVLTPQQFTTSILNKSNLNNSEIEPTPLNFYNTGWFSYFILFCFIVYAFLKKSFFNKQRIIFNSFFNYRYTNKLIREGNLYNESGFYFLLFLSLISISMLFLNWGVYYFYGGFIFINSLVLFTKILAVFICFYFGKMFLLLILSQIFKLNKIYSEFVLTQHVFFIVFGIFSLFISTVLFYTTSQFIVLASLIVFTTFYFNYLFRLFKVLIGTGFFSVFYFFLYICTLEIMPILFAYKLLNK